MIDPLEGIILRKYLWNVLRVEENCSLPLSYPVVARTAY
jgi:hypothetical protein